MIAQKKTNRWCTFFKQKCNSTLKLIKVAFWIINYSFVMTANLNFNKIKLLVFCIANYSMIFIRTFFLNIFKAMINVVQYFSLNIYEYSTNFEVKSAIY